MATEAHLDVGRRHDFVLLFDVTGGNPNGDPDNGNAPRMDPATGHGWVSDVALKRKVRNFISDAYGDRPGYEIYVREGVALNASHREESEKLGLPATTAKKKRPSADQQAVANALAERYYDIRTFGAVMSTGDHPAGQLRGPVQLVCPSVSVDPIEASDLTITRVAVTSEDELKKMASGDGGKDREMGGKDIVPYALFRAHGFVTPSFAERTGFTSDDLAAFWDALARMWSLDRSASRGMTGCRGIHVFSHADKYGQGHPDAIFRRLDIQRLTDEPARMFDAYKLDLDTSGLDDVGIEYTFLGA